MADESALNTFNLQVTLPIFPDLSFKIKFNCNGVIFTSDAFDNSADALEWAQDELADFGDWSVINNVLYLDNSLCGVASLGTLTMISA